MDVNLNRVPKSANLYERKGAKGKIRFYIVHYYGLKPNGKRDTYTEYLELDAWENPKNDEQRKKTKSSREFARRRAAEIMTDVENFRYNRKNLILEKYWLIETMQKWADKRYTIKGSTHNKYKTLHRHLRAFIGADDVKLSLVTKKFCIDFFHHLKTYKANNKGSLTDSASKQYMAIFKYFLEQLAFEEIIPSSPARGIVVGTVKSKPKEFLELSEVQTLIDTECRFPEFKRYFLFSCFSATAFAECRELIYDDFRKADDGSWYLNTERIKTAKHTRLLMSHKAMEYILPLGKASEKVFPFIKTNTRYEEIRRWVKDAGIEKHITPHCAKNTFAVAFYRKYRDIGDGFKNDLKRYMQHEDWETTERYLGKVLGSEYSSNLSPDFF